MTLQVSLLYYTQNYLYFQELNKLNQISSPHYTQRRAFGIYCRPDSPDADSALEKAKNFLGVHNIDTITLKDILNGQNAEVMLAFGGDGSLLHAARLVAQKQIPVLGVNFGRIGYLCSVSSEQLEGTLYRLINKNYDLEDHTMLSCQVYEQDQIVWESQALNEVLIGGCNRTVCLEVFIDGVKFAVIRGDGLILSTKTGSTAYSFSAGGPVLLVDNVLCLVASNAVFSSSIRSLVLSADTVVRIKNLTFPAKPYVVADGQIDCTINKDTIVELKKSELKSKFITFGNTSPIQDLHRSFQELMMRAF
ncbi:MAG: NAD(+)/NADH kinase [Candidatus Bruticola sp.]